MPTLNYLLRSQIFVNGDRQLCAAHLILDYELISRNFLGVGNSIRANDFPLARINVFRPSFLALHDLSPVDHPISQGNPFAASHFNKCHLDRLLSRKELHLLLLLRRKLTGSNLKRKPLLYQRPKKKRTSTRAIRLLPR